jgi:hypothetical protein
MDDRLLRWAPDGPLIVAPLGCGAGPDYRRTGDAGRTYYMGLGAPDVRVAPEPRLSVGATVRSIVRAGTVVIPGGSTARLRSALIGTAIGAALRAHVARGGMVIGAAAGARALAAWMVVAGAGVRAGLGLVPDVLVVPAPDGQAAVLREVLRRRVAGWMTVVGVPAHSGVLYDGRRLHAVGADRAWLLTPSGARLRLSSLSQVHGAGSPPVAR